MIYYIFGMQKKKKSGFPECVVNTILSIEPKIKFSRTISSSPTELRQDSNYINIKMRSTTVRRLSN